MQSSLLAASIRSNSVCLLLYFPVLLAGGLRQLDVDCSQACHRFFSSFFFSLLTLFMVSSVIIVFQSLNHVRLFATPWTAACQASLSFTNSRSLLKLMYIESVMLSNHLVLCCPFLLLPSIFPRIRVFSNESALCIREPNY